jgi:hypothetical protein
MLISRIRIDRWRFVSLAALALALAACSVADVHSERTPADQVSDQESLDAQIVTDADPTAAVTTSSVDGGIDSDGAVQQGTSTEVALDTDVRTDPAATVEMPTPTIAVFFAGGKLGRTLMTCDGGASWINDVSDDETAKCFTNGLDCDHHPRTNSGLVFTGETVVATWGHGFGGTVTRSIDGVGWTSVPDQFQTDGLVFANDKLYSLGSYPRVSTDQGKTWARTTATYLSVTIRGAASMRMPNGADRVLGIGQQDGAWTGVYSDDDGVTWGPMTMNGCVWGEFATVADVALLSGGGVLCRSVDFGVTWTPITEFGASTSHVLRVKDAVWALAGAELRKSTDGMTWTTEAAASDLANRLLNVAYSPDLDSFVAVTSGFGSSETDQSFYTSKDAKIWTKIDPAKAKPGHPIQFVIPAVIKETPTCHR